MIRARPTVAVVDLDAIRHNVSLLKPPNAQLMAVVKANGYGLGATQVARAALEGGATRLGVACVDEGVQLRRAGLDCPILVMGYAAPEESLAAVRNRLALTVHRRETAAALEASAEAEGMQAAVHIKVDTGMHRLGFEEKDMPELIAMLTNTKNFYLKYLKLLLSTSSKSVPYSAEKLLSSICILAMQIRMINALLSLQILNITFKISLYFSSMNLSKNFLLHISNLQPKIKILRHF